MVVVMMRKYIFLFVFFGCISGSSVFAINDSATFTHIPKSSHKAMTNLPHPKSDEVFSNMDDVNTFVDNESNDCANKTDNTEYCYKILTVELGSTTTTGTTQCPEGYILLMSTNTTLKYVDPDTGNTVTSSQVDYTNSSTISDIVSSSVINYYQANSYSCTVDSSAGEQSSEENLQEIHSPQGKSYDTVKNETCGSDPSEYSYITIGGKYLGFSRSEMSYTSCRYSGGGVAPGNCSCYCDYNPFTGCGLSDAGWSGGWCTHSAGSYWNTKCKKYGYPTKCTRSAGYYYNSSAGKGGSAPSGYSLPSSAINPITGTTVGICGKIVYNVDYWVESESN